MTQKKDYLYALFYVLTGFVFVFLIALAGHLFNNTTLNVFKLIFINDAKWYESIIKHGYYTNASLIRNDIVEGAKNGMSNWAFFPSVSLITKFLNIITFNKIPIIYLGSFVSALAFYFFIVLLFKYLRTKNIKINHFILCTLFVLQPFIPYCLTLYNESFFMLLVVIFLLLTDSKKYLYAGLIGALMTLTKVQGILFFLYLFVAVYKNNITHGKNFLQTFFYTVKSILANPKQVLALFLFPLGIFVFMTILYFSGLNPLAFIHVQAGWKKTNNFFLITIIKKIANVNAKISILALVLCVYLTIKKNYLTALIVFLSVVLNTSSAVASMYRYLIAIVIFIIEIYKIIINNKKLVIFAFCVYYIAFSVYYIYYPFILGINKIY
jgi:Gpi18-like mannosyltransferase